MDGIKDKAKELLIEGLLFLVIATLVSIGLGIAFSPVAATAFGPLIGAVVALFVLIWLFLTTKVDQFNFPKFMILLVSAFIWGTILKMIFPAAGNFIPALEASFSNAISLGWAVVYAGIAMKIGVKLYDD